ncbi:MAG: ABC transporter permease [Planctomycetota bacterium]
MLDLIAPYLANSLVLAVLAMLFTWGVALPLGTYCAVHRNGFFDRGSSLLSFVGMSVPSYFLALLALYLTVAYVNERLGFAVLPIGGAASPNAAALSPWQRWLDRGQHLVLPVLVLSCASIAELQRITRGSLLETLRAQYVTVARAKGLPERTVIYRYAFLNAVNPLLSIFGSRLSSLVSGAALVEIVFAYPGMGKIVLEATLSHDLHVMMAAVLIGSVLLVFGNLLADILLRFVDPRIDHAR